MSEIDLGALERNLLEYNFNETDQREECRGKNETLVLMTPSFLMSSTKEPPASLSPVEQITLIQVYQRRCTPKLFCESPRRRRIDGPMRVAFLSTLPEEKRARYQGQL